jgi:hypothetical protein
MSKNSQTKRHIKTDILKECTKVLLRKPNLLWNNKKKEKEKYMKKKLNRRGIIKEKEQKLIVGDKD